MLQDIIKFLNKDIFVGIANLLSIVGFIITLYVFFAVRGIKKFYQFKARVPDLNKKLRAHSSELSNCLNDFDGSSPKIEEELALVEITLKSIKRKTDGDIKQSISNALKQIRNYPSVNEKQHELRSIYVHLIQIVEEITDRRKDQQWENDNG